MKNGISIGMNLQELFKDLPGEIKGNPWVEVRGISSNSREVKPGDLFIAKAGFTHKGSDFIKEALSKGAVAIVANAEYSTDRPQIIVDNPVTIEGLLAARFFNHPSQKLLMIGLTGTNGKTTTSYLIRQILGNDICGLIGTIEYLVGNQTIEASLTTPDVISNHKMLASMVENDLKVAVMEATSIALTQNRLDEIDFDIALFTNFSQDHLDYHGNMETYLKAKARLFENLSVGKIAIVNSDFEESSALLQNCKAKVKTYAIHKEADYRVLDIQLNPGMSRFSLLVNGQTHLVEVPLTGIYNVYNTLAAISVAYESNIKIEDIIQKVAQLNAPKGRLESIPNQLGVQIFVDFAHTEDALKNAILALKQTKHHRLITLFGCGGDRDPKKRPLMGNTVSKFSDITIITSDNPRSEDPQKICHQIFEGCLKNKEIFIEVDRKEAILKALMMLEKGDILLIAGRGHERYQIIGTEKISFEDVAVTKEFLEKRVTLSSF